MKINISDFVTNPDKTVSGQVIDIIGNQAVVINDLDWREYPENCREIDLSDLTPA